MSLNTFVASCAQAGMGANTVRGGVTPRGSPETLRGICLNPQYQNEPLLGQYADETFRRQNYEKDCDRVLPIVYHCLLHVNIKSTRTS
jgi:hypothetical protein